MSEPTYEDLLIEVAQLKAERDQMREKLAEVEKLREWAERGLKTPRAMGEISSWDDGYDEALCGLINEIDRRFPKAKE